MSTWFFDEVAFVLLPIGVIAVMTLLVTAGPKENLLLLREWGFATAVILASALNRFVALKVIVQRDRSTRVLVGTRLLVLLLILAVLCLALSVLREHGVAIDANALLALQMCALLFGLLFLGVAIYYEVKHDTESRALPSSLSSASLRRYIGRHLEESYSRLDIITDAFERTSENNSNDSALPVSIVTQELSYRLSRIERRCGELRRAWNLSTTTSAATDNGESQYISVAPIDPVTD